MGVGPTKQELESVQEERNLGVIITADLKSSSQCIKSEQQQESNRNGEKEFQSSGYRRFQTYLQDLYPATSGVLHPSLVSTSC